jgi:hypothetical protein
MDQEQLNEVIKFHLVNFNNEHVEINNDTVFNTVLSTKDGFGLSNSKNLFRGFIRWTMKSNGHKDKPWPKDWFEKSVTDLSSKILTLLFLIFSFTAQSQLQVSVGASKTDLKGSALTIAASYINSLDSAWKNQDYLLAGKHSFFLISPEATILTGTEDAFSSIILKASGLLATFKTTTVAGQLTPNSARTFQTFPMSVGVETNNQFSTINAIAEVGWSPWYQAESRAIPDAIKRTKFGIFLQGGYKFLAAGSRVAPEGGQIDESQEAPNSTIFRTKGSFGIDTKALLNVNGLAVGLVGNADVWYDFINSAVYHKIDARGRFYITPVNYIDLIYQKGSGAPNFNQGDQYGVGLTVTF